MAIADLTITAERQKHIDYSKPFLDLGLLLYMAKPTETEGGILFLEPFSTGLWITFALSIVFVSMVVSLIK